MSTQLVSVNGAELEVDEWGTGDPMVFIQTALTADEFRPVAMEPALRQGFRRVVYHRRGYGGSTPVRSAGSIVSDAADCRELLRALRIGRAHVVGLSYSGAVALQLAADSPESVQTVTVIEPPPVHTPSAPEFRAANDRLIEIRRSRGPEAALDAFLSMVIGAQWRTDVEGRLPGAATQMACDTATFFDVDVPALLDWRFSRLDAQRIDCPVLYIGGSESGLWFAQVRDLILDWIPRAQDIMIEGADHSLALTHPREVAAALSSFTSNYPLIED